MYIETKISFIEGRIKQIHHVQFWAPHSKQRGQTGVQRRAKTMKRSIENLTYEEILDMFSLEKTEWGT